MRGRLAHRIICGSAALAAACLAAACGGGPAPLVQPEAFPIRITADWLRAQPGQTRGDFSFHLLDARCQPLRDWAGLAIQQEVTDSGVAEFTLHSAGSPPDDVYLYVTYPGSSWALDIAELPSSRSGEYALLSVPHRIVDVLVVGLTRLGDRSASAAAGPLCRLRFAAGHERTYRSLSQVNEDPGSAPVLDTEEVGGKYQLKWTERNLGDYNNNSQVEIADITPLGLHFGETSATAADPLALELVDGDENGEINLADLVPIGRNFGRYIQGYSVYHSADQNPYDLSKYASLGQPTILRGDVVSASSPDALKHRLTYTFDFVPQDGHNYFYVRAWSGDSGDSEGPRSNFGGVAIFRPNREPYWDALPVITMATGQTESIALVFNDAIDPEGTAITYVTHYIKAALGAINSPQASVMEVAEADLPAGPPYTYTLSGLTPGETYHILIQARDADGLLSTNSEVTDVRVPAVGLSDAPWAGWRGGGRNTGSNPTATAVEPLTEAWTAPVGPSVSARPIYGMVFAAAGWLATETDSGRVTRIASQDGNLIDSSADPGAGTLPLGLTADQDRLYEPGDGGMLVWNPGSGAAMDTIAGSGSLSAVPVGDYLFLQDRDAASVQLKAGGSEFIVSAPYIASDPQYAPPVATDGTTLYSGTDKLLSLALPDGNGAAETAATINPQGLLIDSQAGGVEYVDGQLAFHAAGQQWQLPAVPAGTPPPLPCLVRYAPTPLLVFPNGAEPGSVLTAVNADTGATQWICPALPFAADDIFALTAGASRIFVCGPTQLCVLDLNGLIRQTLDLGSRITSEPVPVGAGVYVMTRAGLKCLRTDASPDGPPIWQGTSAKPGGGIRALLDPLDSTLTVQWDYAVDDHALPVYYSIYYSADSPPQFDAPFTQTQLVTDIPDDGQQTHSYSIGPLDMSKRWYVGVRAYDRPWAESPNIDANTNWLALTPGWQEERLRAGAELPPGEVYFLEGLLDPHGTMHLVYNDRASAALTHVYGTTGAWTVESSNIGGYAFSAFNPVWNGPQDRFAIGVTSSSLVGTLSRTGADTWTYTDITSAQPVANPMVALAYPAGSGEAALSYTRQTNGSFPPPERYEIVQTTGGLWQPPGPLDAANNSGRDIAMLLNPLDDSDPWTLMQRGFEYAPNHLTPSRGELTFAQSDGAGGWTLSVVDSGSNGPDSDCGKRCRLMRDGPDAAPVLHAGYLDLNADPDNPIGELRYARYTDGNWTTESVARFDLSFQTASLQFTYGEIGLGLLDGEPVIAMLERSTMTASASDPHLAQLWLWQRQPGGGWLATALTDSVWQFPRDREPCVLLADGNVLHVFYATLSDEADPKADTIVHLWRDMSQP